MQINKRKDKEENSTGLTSQELENMKQLLKDLAELFSDEYEKELDRVLAEDFDEHIIQIRYPIEGEFSQDFKSFLDEFGTFDQSKYPSYFWNYPNQHYAVRVNNADQKTQ
jgi:hypothetical protein